MHLFGNPTCYYPSSIYSCSIGRILEYVFCHLGCWAVKRKFLKRPNFCLGKQLFGVVFSCFHGQKFDFSIFFLHFSNRIKKLDFCLENMKKPPQKVAYLSKNSVVSEILILLPNSPNGRKNIPKCGL